MCGALVATVLVRSSIVASCALLADEDPDHLPGQRERGIGAAEDRVEVGLRPAVPIPSSLTMRVRSARAWAG